MSYLYVTENISLIKTDVARLFLTYILLQKWVEPRRSNKITHQSKLALHGHYLTLYQIKITFNKSYLEIIIAVSITFKSVQYEVIKSIPIDLSFNYLYI